VTPEQTVFLTLAEHGALVVVLGYLWYIERNARLARDDKVENMHEKLDECLKASDQKQNLHLPS